MNWLYSVNWFCSVMSVTKDGEVCTGGDSANDILAMSALDSLRLVTPLWLAAGHALCLWVDLVPYTVGYTV